ncbi:MAG TPA: DUF3617 family protein [Usitatibacteraceae bacterium]
MKKQLIPVSAVLMSLLSLAVHADPLPIVPGKYEVVTTAGVLNGKPGEPKKTTRCLRAAEMSNPDYVFNARVINAYKPDATCKVGEPEIKDGKLKYVSDCQVEKVTVEGSVSETAYAVTRTAKSKASGGVSLVSTLEGKRIGECQ